MKYFSGLTSAGPSCCGQRHFLGHKNTATASSSQLLSVLGNPTVRFALLCQGHAKLQNPLICRNAS